MLEAFHAEMRRQFSEMHTSHRPTLWELQQQEHLEDVERLKNILFADLLIKLIKENSLAGHTTPAVINLQTLMEVL